VRVAWSLPVLCPAVAALLGCHLVSGVGDLEFVRPGAGGATTSGSTSTAGSSAGGFAGASGAGGQAGGGGGAGDCLIPIEDDFEDATIDPGLWSVGSPQNIDIGLLSGRLYLAPTPSLTPAWGEVLSVGAYDLTHCAVVVELAAVLTHDGDQMTTFGICEGTWENGASFSIRYGMLQSRMFVGSTQTEFDETTYDPSEHKWLRLREADSTLYFETSPDAQSWTEQYQTTAPAYVTYATIRFAAGTFGVASVDPGRAEFDNLDMPP